MASLVRYAAASMALAACALLANTAIADSLTVVKSGSGAGTVTGSAGAINCGGTCTDTYAGGASVTLTATPSLGSQFTGWLGPCTGAGTCQVTVNGAVTASATFAFVGIGAPRLDPDGTGTYDALTDGLLILRYLFGLTGTQLVNGAVGAGGSRTSSTQIGGYLNDVAPALDIDGNGQVDALTDGLLVIRYLFGLRGSSLVAGAIGPGAQRATAAAIETQIATLSRPLPPTYVYTIVLSNHDYAEVVGSANAPYINSLIASYGLATNYSDSGTHPALPNYLYLVSGATQYPGVVELLPTSSPYFPANADNLGSQLQAAGISWRAYSESTGSSCNLAGSVTYTPRNDPFLYFTAIQNGAAGLCAATNVAYSQFATDLAAGTYRYNWIAPNLSDSGHDPTNDPVTALKASDTWLSTEVPKILASAAYQSGGVIFITWDQAEGRNGDSADQVPMIIISKKIKSAGYQSSTAYNHASYLATVEDIFGLPRLGAAVGIANMLEFLSP